MNHKSAHFPGCKAGPQKILRNHFYLCHGPGAVEVNCPECNKQVLKRYLTTHQKSHEKKTCEVCKREYSLLTIKNHLRTHDMNKQDYYICKLCPTKVEFTNHNSIIRHLKNQHEIATQHQYLDYYEKETREYKAVHK